jgi:hypothetical protein
VELGDVECEGCVAGALCDYIIHGLDAEICGHLKGDALQEAGDYGALLCRLFDLVWRRGSCERFKGLLGEAVVDFRSSMRDAPVSLIDAGSEIQ